MSRMLAPLLFGLFHVAATLSAQQKPFDGRVTVYLFERWETPGTRPGLWLGIATAQEYSHTGHCLHIETQQQANRVLDITLKSVSVCTSLWGHMMSPASASVRLGRADSIPQLPSYIRLRYRKSQDTYYVSFRPTSALLQPQGELTISSLRHSMALYFVQPNTLHISCFAQYMDPCICDTFLKIALDRGRMGGASPSPGQYGVFGVAGAEGDSGVMRGGIYWASEGVRVDTLLALAEDFTRVFDGRNPVGQSPMLMVNYVLWDGRRIGCWRGVCRSN